MQLDLQFFGLVISIAVPRSFSSSRALNRVSPTQFISISVVSYKTSIQPRFRELPISYATLQILYLLFEIQTISFFYFVDFNFLLDLAFFLVFFILYFNFFVLFYNGELFYLNVCNFFLIFFGLFFSLFLYMFTSSFYAFYFLYIGNGLIFLIRDVLCSLEIVFLYCR